MSLEIKTSILINASAAKVWAVLTDFASYPSWNPFITKFEGAPKVGDKIRITAGGMKFKPEVEVYEPNRELKWTGRLLLPGIFDGTHRFYLEEDSEGNCIFYHSEVFRGLLVPLFKSKLKGETKDGFILMNEALKHRVENRLH